MGFLLLITREEGKYKYLLNPLSKGGGIDKLKNPFYTTLT